MTKCCRVCISTKDATEFSRNRRVCKVCENARKLAWAKTRPEVIRAQKTAYFQRNKQKHEDYRQHNLAKIRAAQKLYYQTYYANNKAKFFEHSRNRRARVRNAAGTHTKQDVADILVRQKGLCVGCNGLLDNGFHVDHVMPLCRGGSNAPDNLQLLCEHCNMTKASKDPMVWAAEIGRLFV